MAADHFCLRWNNYQSNMVSELDSLRADEDLVDVTLSCEGHLLKAHKVILSACSSYFRSVFRDNPCRHPVVILKDVNYEDVEALLSFVYQGVVYISEKKLNSFLQTAELLQIRGLTGAATTMKEASFNDTSGNQKVADKSNVPPPPQLLTANLLNSWNKQNMLNSSCSTKSSTSNPPSPSLPLGKRKRVAPNKLPTKENFESSDTNSNQDCSETENELPTVKSEILDTEFRTEEDYNSIDDMAREESSQEENSAYFDHMESDDNDDESSETKKRKSSTSLNSDQISNNPQLKSDLGNSSSAAACSNLFNMVSNYSSSLSSEHNSSVSDARLGRRPCPLCQKIISNKSNLLKHMRIRHSDEYNPAGCTMCGKVFKNKYSLRAHINIYHKEANIIGGATMTMTTTTAAAAVAAAMATITSSSSSSTLSPANGAGCGGGVVDYATTLNVDQLHYHRPSNAERAAVNAYAASSGSAYTLDDTGSYLKQSLLDQFNVSNAPLT